VAAHALDERDIRAAEVRLARAPHERDAAPAGRAGAKHGPEFGAEAERAVDLAIAGAALGLALGFGVQRGHGPRGTREPCELREVGLEELVVDEPPAHRTQRSRFGVLDRKAGEQQRRWIGRLPAPDAVGHYAT
jgi:hypothetical protein